MDYIKVEMCAYLLLTVLCMVVDVRSNAIPAIPPVYFPSDCKGMPNCNGGISTLQNAVMRILAANHEYGKGIHSLHKLYSQLSKDFANLKDQVNSLEKKYVLDKLEETNNKQSTLKPLATLKPSPDLQIHGHVDNNGSKTLQDILKNNHIWTIQEFNSFQTLFINITTNLRTQARRSSKLLKRVNSYRKDVKKYIHLVRHLDKKLLNHVDKDFFEENSRKQKTINTQLESRITQLEQLLNRPDDYLQKDGRYDNSKQHNGCPQGFSEYMSSCYKFSNKTLNWIDAEKNCQETHHQAHLVAVESKLENDYILQYRLFNDVKWSSDFIWLGGLDISGSGKWTWAGTQKAIAYSLWQDGAEQQSQSNNIYHHDCVYTQTQHDSLWSKWNCFTAKLNFVCEIRQLDLLPSEYDKQGRLIITELLSKVLTSYGLM